MANYRFTQDILEAVYASAGNMTTGAQLTTTALRYLNRAYQALYTGNPEIAPPLTDDWVWLRSPQPGTIRVRSENANTCLLTSSSFTATLGTAPALSWAGAFLQTVGEGESDVYRIATHTAGQTAITLRTSYLHDTGTKAVRLFLLDYPLATNVLRIISPMRMFRRAWDMGAPDTGTFEIHGVDLEAMERRYPLALTEATIPTRYAMVTLVTPTTVRFNASLGRAESPYMDVEYEYLVEPDELTGAPGEEPVVPFRHRHVLANLALAYIYQDKGHPGAGSMARLAAQGIAGMLIENRREEGARGNTVGRIYPRTIFRGPGRWRGVFR